MATTWEKSAALPEVSTSIKQADRWKFRVGAGLILLAVVYLILSGTAGGARYYKTVDEILSDSNSIGKTIRVAGVVLGDSIVYDEKSLLLTFSVANVPEDYDNLATALHEAALNPNAKRIQVRVENQVKPDLLKNEAQAILTGTLGTDGVFVATELNLKCPTKFQEAQPGQEIVNNT